MVVHDKDAVFCAKMLRHAAIGAVVGGPLVAVVGWAAMLLLRGPEAPGITEAAGAANLVIGLTALLIGVWIGATVSCCMVRPATGEDRCYGGGMGCAIHLIGGVLAMLVGPKVLPGLFSPLVWYLVGGGSLGVLALLFTVLSPEARRLCCTRNGRPQHGPQ